MSIFMIGLAALIAAIIFKVDPPSWMKQRMVFSVFSFFNNSSFAARHPRIAQGQSARGTGSAPPWAGRIAGAGPARAGHAAVRKVVTREEEE